MEFFSSMISINDIRYLKKDNSYLVKGTIDNEDTYDLENNEVNLTISIENTNYISKLIDLIRKIKNNYKEYLKKSIDIKCVKIKNKPVMKQLNDIMIQIIDIIGKIVLKIQLLIWLFLYLIIF